MSELADIINQINEFRDQREWRRYHNAKDLALSITLEASELLEHFQWRSAEDAVENRREGLAEELADVLIYSLTLAEELGLDVASIISNKLERNAIKYPVGDSEPR